MGKEGDDEYDINSGNDHEPMGEHNLGRKLDVGRDRISFGIPRYIRNN
jgi:hypothetical protein